MCPNLSSDETGKPVIDSNGQVIATVVKVEEGVPYVDPNDDVDPTASHILGWHGDDGIYRLKPTHVDTVTDADVQLRCNL